MSFIAGAYTVTYDGGSIGQIADGFEMEETPISGDLIYGDSLGQRSPQDGVYSPGPCFINFTLMEYNATKVALLMNPTGQQGRVKQASTIVPGMLLSALAKVLVLTKVTGPNASPTSRTANVAIVPPDFAERYTMRVGHRTIPMRLILFPYTSGSDIVHYVDT